MTPRASAPAGLRGALLLLALLLACASGAWGAAPGTPQATPLGDPKPGPIKIAIDAALRNLSLAACPNKTAELLSVLAPNVTVLFPWADPILLNTTDAQEEFFTTSFLPCGVRFTIADIGVGSGGPVPKPIPAPIPPTEGDEVELELGNDKTKPLAVTRLIYVSYGVLDVGKGLALWEGEKVKSDQAGANNNDVFSWKLTVIGWNSDISFGELTAHMRRHQPQTDIRSSASGVPEVVRPSVASSDASLASAAAGRVSFSRRDLLAKKSVDQGFLGNDDTTLLWPLLNTSFGYFAANASAFDLVNASKLFSSAPPYITGEPGSPPLVAATEQDRLDWTEVRLASHKAPGTRHQSQGIKRNAPGTRHQAQGIPVQVLLTSD